MNKKLILFDLDGTLLLSDGAGTTSIERALKEEMGTAAPIEGYSFAGKTDFSIVRDLMRGAGYQEADSEECVKRVCDRYARLLEPELRSPHRHVRALSGVHELLDALASHPGAVLGLLTGNIEQGAHLKLLAVGIDPSQFRVAAYGSEAFSRDALPPLAVSRAGEVMGRIPRGQEVVIIGDTPADMTCGNGIGARAIGVATGPFAVEDLEAAGGDYVFADLTATEEVVAAIFA